MTVQTTTLRVRSGIGDGQYELIDGRDSIGTVSKKTTRYNLRRPFTITEWSYRLHGAASHGGFDRRMDAIAAAEAEYGEGVNVADDATREKDD